MSLISGINSVNCSVSSLDQRKQKFSQKSFAAAQKEPPQKKQENKKKGSFLSWVAGGITVVGAGIAMYFPGIRMKVFNLFKKQVSEEVINNAIRQNAKEMARLKNERLIMINPKTGEVFYRNEGSERQVSIENKARLFNEKIILGHNHPSNTIPIQVMVDDSIKNYNINCDDSPFSLVDLYNGAMGKELRSFVVTQKHIHHLNYNNNYDTNKLLDYLVKKGKIKLKNRDPQTINNALHSHVVILPRSNKKEKLWENEEQIKHHYEKTIPYNLAKREALNMQKLCDAMGWTYWREPLPKAS